MSLALLVADRQSGKTSTCQHVADAARARGLTVGGILSPAVHEEGRCVGYRVVDLSTGESALLATLEGPGVEQVGRFHFTEDGLALGRAALAGAAEKSDQLVIVDEVGPLELAGGGWAEAMDQLAVRSGFTLATVRTSLVEQVAERWNVSHQLVYDLAAGSSAVVDSLMNLVKREE
jgi:nucleoside-triphosphatase THEP1